MLDKKRIGKTIAFYRKELGMTQKELADLLHISYQAVSKWEVGMGIPTVEMLYELSSLFHVSVDALLNNERWDNRAITYREIGLDSRKLHTLKKELLELNTKDARLISANYADAALFQIDMSEYKEPVYSVITCVPGSKEQLAVIFGYDREICMDTVSSAINHLLQHGMKPVILKSMVWCDGSSHDQLCQMAEGFQTACEKNNIMYSGMEISAQPLNYKKGEYHIAVTLIGVAEKKDVFRPEHVQAGDVVIGIRTDGIDGTNYPVIKVMADRNKNLINERLANRQLFLDEIMKVNTAYTDVFLRLQKEKLIHGACRVGNTVISQRIARFLPEELGVCIDLSAIPVSDLYRFLYRQDMIGRNVFQYHFHFGIGMLVIVSKENKERAMEIISRNHPCFCIGRVEQCHNKGNSKKIWTKGEIQW